MGIEDYWSEEHTQYLVAVGDKVQLYDGLWYEVIKVSPNDGSFRRTLKQVYDLGPLGRNWALSTRGSWTNIEKGSKILLRRKER